MPTNLKNLLSRSRSKNELKGRGDGKDESTCSCNGAEGGYPHTTCQCQRSGSESASTAGTDSPGRQSISNCQLGESSLRRDISSRSLFSLPAEDDLTGGSRSKSPASSLQVSSTSPLHTHPMSIRKCETVLALSNFAINSNSPETSQPTPASTSTSRVKVMKDRILSSSSSALTTLFQTSNKTTSKLFSGWKFSSNRQSSHPHNTSITKNTESSKSQQSINEPPNSTVPSLLLTPMNRLRRHGSITNIIHSCRNSRHSSLSSIVWTDDAPPEISCRLCLYEVKFEDTVEIQGCSCRYCKDCVIAYVSFEVQEGAYDIACPDSSCEKQGVLSQGEIQTLVPAHIVEKHKKFRLYKDVETDCELMWCPTPGCETICKIQESDVNGPKPRIPTIQCTRCQHVYCTQCRLPMHPDLSCESYRQKLIRQGKLNIIDDEPFAAYDSIKKCPFCHVPIEKDSGCAQMMCKRCKHVFCWYCLSSLDDDFLLRHYDKGPCKNKLGHSRASVVWHRTQVIGIFAGFGLLVLLASPLLILAAPCLLCCRCRYCTNHLDQDESPVSI